MDYKNQLNTFLSDGLKPLYFSDMKTFQAVTFLHLVGHTIAVNKLFTRATR